MIILDGIKDTDLGLLVSWIDFDEPEIASTIDNTLHVPGKHGDYDFGADMGPKPFYFQVSISPQPTKYDRDLKIDQLKQILLDKRGKPRYFPLILENRPDRKYMVRYSGSLSVNKLLTLGKFTLPLVAFEDPYPDFIVSSEEITWDSDTPFLSDVPLDAEYIFQINSSQSLPIHNFGSMVVRPTIEIEGSATSLTLSLNGKSFSFPDFTDSLLIVDAKRYEVTLNGVNFLFEMSGDDIRYLELDVGENMLGISGSNLNIQITVKFYAKYL